MATIDRDTMEIYRYTPYTLQFHIDLYFLHAVEVA